MFAAWQADPGISLRFYIAAGLGSDCPTKSNYDILLKITCYQSQCQYGVHPWVACRVAVHSLFEQS
jgi:hypothetical protein